jgi:hypothetical protein
MAWQAPRLARRHRPTLIEVRSALAEIAMSHARHRDRLISSAIHLPPRTRRAQSAEIQQQSLVKALIV